MKLTPGQSRRLHQLLNSLGIMDQKKSMVIDYSKGRAESSNDLLYSEATTLIKHLESLTRVTNANAVHQSADRMRKKIISMAHEMGWELANHRADMNRIDEWCIKSSLMHKKLSLYTVEELPKLVSQFENVYLSTIKSSNK